MFKAGDKWDLFVSSGRVSGFSDNVWKKILSLDLNPYVSKKIIGLPDFGDDGTTLNGLVFKSENRVFPLGAGKDIGCGFRVLHVPRNKVDIEKIEREYQFFAKNITSYKPGTTLLDEEIEQIFYSNSDRPSLIKQEEVKLSFGRIGKGNHFIEFRTIDIKDQLAAKKLGFETGDIIIHIHSGSGLFLEYMILKYAALFNNNRGYQNAYELHFPFENCLIQQFLADAERCLQVSIANRNALERLIIEWIGSAIRVLDVSHDVIEVEGTTVHYQKAVQRYSEYKGLDIAIIPTTIEEQSYLVNRTGHFSFVNHGSGEGEEGDTQNIGSVKTNFDKTSSRTFFGINDSLEIATRNAWYKIICNLNPWICIKNFNEW
ncbi:RtcB family protein [Peribacillus deserti]|uniref:RtcB family protein n=1 Tax=Peribacillus deserti TaxID=673318 RepID=UPI0015E0F807|nr:RtcB family protein [Peribacillus deserti]